MLICNKTEICKMTSCQHHGRHDPVKNGSCDKTGCDMVGSDAKCVPVVAYAQKLVVANTAARGYRKGWTAEQFACRQIAKLVEELSELSEIFWTPQDRAHISGWEKNLDYAAIEARRHFDLIDKWDHAEVFSAEEAMVELADIQVVVFNLAEALAEISGESFDVVQAAVDKSEKDVERGVR